MPAREQRPRPQRGLLGTLPSSPGPSLLLLRPSPPLCGGAWKSLACHRPTIPGRLGARSLAPEPQGARPPSELPLVNTSPAGGGRVRTHRGCSRSAGGAEREAGVRCPVAPPGGVRAPGPQAPAGVPTPRCGNSPARYPQLPARTSSPRSELRLDSLGLQSRVPGCSPRRQRRVGRPRAPCGAGQRLPLGGAAGFPEPEARGLLRRGGALLACGDAPRSLEGSATAPNFSGHESDRGSLQQRQVSPGKRPQGR